MSSLYKGAAISFRVLFYPGYHFCKLPLHCLTIVSYTAAFCLEISLSATDEIEFLILIYGDYLTSSNTDFK